MKFIQNNEIPTFIYEGYKLFYLRQQTIYGDILENKENTNY